MRLKMTNKQFSIEFWKNNPQYISEHRNNKTQNDYICDIRVGFCDYLEHSDLTEDQKHNYVLTAVSKKDIKTIPTALDKITSLRGVYFKWKKPTKNLSHKTMSGFIAQEVQEIIPDLVSNNNDGFKTVNYIGVIPHLVEAIKEQQKMIEELKAKIENK